MGARDGMRQATPVGVGWRIEELHDGVWTWIACTPFEDRMRTLVYGGEPSEWEKAGLRQVQGGSRRAVPGEGTRRAERMDGDRWRVLKWDGIDWTTIALKVCEGWVRDIADRQEPTLHEAMGTPPPPPTADQLAAVLGVGKDDQEQARPVRLAVRIAAVTACYAQELAARGIDAALMSELSLDCAGRLWEQGTDRMLV